MIESLKYSAIIGTVVLYNPEDDTLENIKSYINQIDKLIVIDNSTKYNHTLINNIKNEFDNIIYINNHSNLGIATALNIACEKAIELGYDWILTMDQDSKFVDFDQYIRCFNSIEKKEMVSTISPNPFFKNEEMNINRCKVIEKTQTLTSGTLLNLLNYEKVGKFTDKLFIDEVDHDYCLKSISTNLKVLELSNIHLIHSLGEVKQRSKKLKTQHNHVRVYYMTRNAFYMASKYGKTFPSLYSYQKVFYRFIYKKIFRILRHEDDKILKFKYMYFGVRDFIRDNYGKI